MITQFVPQEACLGCSGCCRFAEAKSVWSVRLLKEEQKRLALSTCDLPLIPTSRKEQYVCIFFAPCKNKCLKYAQRPFECQLYPFLLNRSGKKLMLAVDTHCPFVQKDMHSKKFNAYVSYLAGLFRKPRYLSMLNDNTHIICRYPGVLDLKELFLKK